MSYISLSDQRALRRAAVEFYIKADHMTGVHEDWIETGGGKGLMENEDLIDQDIKDLYALLVGVRRGDL